MSDVGERICALTKIASALSMGVISLEVSDGVILREEDYDLLDIAINMEHVMKRVHRYKKNSLQFLFDFLHVQKNAMDEKDDPLQAVASWLETELEGIVLEIDVN